MKIENKTQQLLSDLLATCERWGADSYASECVVAIIKKHFPDGKASKIENVEKRYSGELSREFWESINSIKDQELRDELYGLGCDLQNLEHRVLKKLIKYLDDKKDDTDLG